MPVTHPLSVFFKKLINHPASFGSEIAVALVVKFLLLAGIWWLFFAGNKQPVDEAIIADKIFGVQQSAISSEKTRRIVNDYQ